MGDVAHLVRETTTALLRRRRDLIILAAKHRAKFEGWLKFELAIALDADPHITRVEPEAAYGKRNNCDIACHTDEGTYLLELKTCNTSWRVRGVQSKTRPITDNVDGVISDIEKLRAGRKGAGGISVFLFFPVPNRLWSDSVKGLHHHLERIESAAGLPTGSLFSGGKFVELTDDYGVAVFVVEVFS